MLRASIVMFTALTLCAAEAKPLSEQECLVAGTAITAADLPAEVKASVEALIDPAIITGYRSATIAGELRYVVVIKTSASAAAKPLLFDAKGEAVALAPCCDHAGHDHHHAH